MKISRNSFLSHLTVTPEHAMMRRKTEQNTEVIKTERNRVLRVGMAALFK